MKRVRHGAPMALAALATLATLATTCGGTAPTGGTPPPDPSISCSNLPNTRTILIVNNAACPQSLTVPRGTQVTFINNDSRAHEMFSEPHPEHTDCTELNQVGHLEPGQRRDSGNLNTARRCGFHDHLNDSSALKGTITIQ